MTLQGGYVGGQKTLPQSGTRIINVNTGSALILPSSLHHSLTQTLGFLVKVSGASATQTVGQARVRLQANSLDQGRKLTTKSHGRTRIDEATRACPVPQITQYIDQARLVEGKGLLEAFGGLAGNDCNNDSLFRKEAIVSLL